ncbi:hypothetical protein NDU88_003601 [Pleurodeles waltl]|uniref:Uncharacterized protein n=1 Tax=Pleurodeles waltl TaxID=8319 RepID=A0AAV7QFY3_PLEWA|nr:hypothetical protein NDU88_003601 [Pleurodeles waltl]
MEQSLRGRRIRPRALPLRSASVCARERRGKERGEEVRESACGGTSERPPPRLAVSGAVTQLQRGLSGNQVEMSSPCRTSHHELS